LNLFIIYKPDEKGYYELRPHIVRSPTDVRPYLVRCISKDLATLRLPFLGWGLRKTSRGIGDHPDIIEIWQ
jgi:hypothetical protein